MPTAPPKIIHFFDNYRFGEVGRLAGFEFQTTQRGGFGNHPRVIVRTRALLGQSVAYMHKLTIVSSRFNPDRITVCLYVCLFDSMGSVRVRTWQFMRYSSVRLPLPFI